MNKKFLLLSILFFCQNLLIYADDCSVFSCSQLSAGNNQICSFTSNSRTCESYYTNTGCGNIDNEADCIKAKVFPLNKKCRWDNTANGNEGACIIDDILCSEYSSTPPSNGLTCESLKATGDNYCITLTDGKCAEESGCPTTTEGCTSHKPLDSEHKWDHTRKCKVVGTSCKSEPKLCEDFNELEDDEDICEKLSSDNTKKKCFLKNSPLTCIEQFIKCEDYTGNTESECTDISPYISDPDNYKCIFDTTCKTKIKGCSDFDNDSTNCMKYTPENTSKRCVYTTINGQPKCIEVFKTCSGYSNSQEAKNETFCNAIVEDLYHKCIFKSSSSSCESKQNKCSDYSTDEVTCNQIQVNDTYKCEFNDNQCIEVRQYKDCNLYTGKDRSECEAITPPESNKKCILKNDKQCVSVTKECEEYTGQGIIEFECINNYKPLDEHKICIFKGNVCISAFKYCSDYLGEDEEKCLEIEPINNDENYSIKCKMNNDNKCVRVDIPCQDGNGNDPKVCSSIIPKDSKKKCILRDTTCKEEYKTCQDYNDDTNVEIIDKNTCESITSNNGKKCTHTPPTNQGGRGTCTDSTNKYECVADFNIINACASIKLSDISKQCVYNDLNGECTIKSKNCLELTFNGNENGIEDICKTAEASENKKCILSPEKTHCLEVDSSLVIDENGNNNGGNGENGSNGGDNNDNNNQQENNSNFGKEIYLNKLFIFILHLLF